jgi:hypothetical protein
MPAPKEFIDFVDNKDNQEQFIATLKAAVGIHR